MVFYVIVAIVLVALSMNKLMIIVISTYFQFIQMPIIEIKIWYNLHPNKPMMKYCHGW